MTAEFKSINFKGYHLFYQTFGSGKKALLAFHGFDRTSNDFKVFEKGLGNYFTIYSFDIFFHGKSLIDDTVINPCISENDLCEMLQYFMMEKNLQFISIMGYSLGGRLALGLVEVMPGQIENLFLMAPDGIKKNFWNSFATRSKIGKFLFRKVVHEPKPLLNFVSLLSKIKLMHPKVEHFLRSELSDKEKRIRVLKVWNIFRDIIPEKDRIQKNINRYNINTILFYGKYDVVITVESVLTFSKSIKKTGKLIVLECGHKLFSMHEKISEEIIVSVSK